MVSRKRKNYSNLDGSGQPNQIPVFFKFFIPDTGTQRLISFVKRAGEIQKTIPPAYAKKMQGNLPDKAFLRDRYGNIWPVELARIENNTFFVDGWETFVKDNSVDLGDFLVFQFDGQYVFDVKLMGHTGCDKNGVGSLLFSVKEEEEENNEAGEEGEGRRGAGEEEEEEEEEEEQEDEENEEEQEEEEEENLEDNYGTANETNEDIEEEEEEEEEDEEERQVKEEATKSKASRKDLKKMKKSIKAGPFDLAGHGAGAKTGTESWKETKVDPYGFDIFKSGKIPQPKNPYFVTKIRSKRKDELYVPIDVIRDHNLDLPSKIILRDPQEREWTTRLRTWSDGRKWYCGGWRNLCKLNLIGEKDTCICEFVKRRGGGLLISVTSILSEDDVSIQKK